VSIQSIPAIQAGETVAELLRDPGPHAVSLFMPVVRAGGRETRQNAVAFKNLVRDAYGMLLECGCPKREAEERTAEVEAAVEGSDFREGRSEGFALFLGDAFLRAYHLPYEVALEVEAGRYFHIRPVLPLQYADQRFHVLAVSQDSVRLLEAHTFGEREVNVPGLPGNLHEALPFEGGSGEEHLQQHTGTPPVHGQRGTAIIHGQGGFADARKDILLRYLRRVNDSVAAALRTSSTPLVFAGVDYLFPLYREANTYPHLHPKALQGGVGEMDDRTLAEAARRLLEPYFERAEHNALQRMHDARDNARTALELEGIYEAIVQGRVDALFIPRSLRTWGRLDPHAARLEQHPRKEPGDVELFNALAVETLRQGGTVHAADPGIARQAALLRY
jgi:hypothetical protein